MEGLLTILKLVFVAALYLFLFRVVQVVVRELRPAALLPAAAPPTPTTPTVASTSAPVLPRGAAGLVFLEPASRAGQLLTITSEETIGRAPGCEISLAEDTAVSSIHARIAPTKKGLLVEDLGSTNGTLVNGKRITSPTRVQRGDRVQCGSTSFEVVT
ncbi:MAG: FHA domain-containing protein [Acidimicrobiia bacterium]